MKRTLLTPEQSGSGTCVQLLEAGSLYIQSFDAYGFQRELSLREIADGFELHAYQHPGRRAIVKLSRVQGRKLMAALIARAESEVYRGLLFNSLAPKNAGFVRFHEAIFRGDEFRYLLEMV